MTSPCSPRLSTLTRTGALAVVFGLTLAPTAAAFAQDAGPSTVRALIGGDGSVSSVERFGGGEAPSADDLPVTVAISQAANGDATTTNYRVENTTVQSKQVSYVDAAGKTATVTQDVALPLVAQLSVRLPASRTDVQAFGARITKLADGSSELVWSMVLFNPIGAPVSDVSFTAMGTGEPLARIDVAAVQPNATPGLSATGQAANATVNGNGILSTVAGGASEGLTKLADGVGQLLAGLDKLEAGAIQLNEGIAKGADGAEQLADGSETAKAGSSQLAAGAGQLDAGADKISAGLGSALDGGVALADGSGAVADGADTAATGAAALADGLALISGGLDQLSAAAGLPAALDGAKRLQVGVDQLRAGLGSPTTAGTILNGLARIDGGLAQVGGGLAGLGAPTGLPAAKGGVDLSRGGVQLSKAGVDQILAGIRDALKAGGSIDQLSGGLQQTRDLVDLARAEIACSATPTVGIGVDGNPCTELITASGALGQLRAGVESNGTSDAAPAPADGLRKKNRDAEKGLTQISGGLGQVDGGLDQVSTGLQTAIDGVGLLGEGVVALQAGNTLVTGGVNQVAAGLESTDPLKPGVAEGLDSLVAGLTAAVAGISALDTGAGTAVGGSQELAVGLGRLADGAALVADGNGALADGLSQLFTGSRELTAGTSKLATGAGALDAGIGKIADGQRQVADGLPAAVDGSGQIADGLGAAGDGADKVKAGLGDVQTKAVGVLASQFTQGTTLARQQLAGLDAAAELVNTTPGAALTTYVLTQSTDGITLASSSSDSNTARNIGLGAGGAVLLLGGIAGGFLSGRRAGGVA